MASPPLPGRRRHTNIAVSRAGTPADRPSLEPDGGDLDRHPPHRQKPPWTRRNSPRTALVPKTKVHNSQLRGQPPVLLRRQRRQQLVPLHDPSSTPRAGRAPKRVQQPSRSLPGLVWSPHIKEPPGSPIADEVLRRLGRCSRRDPLTPAGRRTGGNLRLAAGGLADPTVDSRTVSVLSLNYPGASTPKLT